MERVQSYYRQRVTDSDLNAMLDDVENGIGLVQVALCDKLGITTGLAVAAQAPESLSVDVGSGEALDKVGAVIVVDVAQVLDCTIDEDGASTTPVASGSERWLTIFLKLSRVPSEPKVDGYGNIVYYRQTSSFDLLVRQAEEQPVGTNLLPALDDRYILLADVCRVQGEATISAARVDLSRTERLLERTLEAHQSSSSAGIHHADQIIDDTAALYHGANVQLTLDALATYLSSHLGGTPSRHDATEIDDEVAGGYHAASVQGTLTALNSELLLRERIHAYAAGEDLVNSGDEYGLLGDDCGAYQPLEARWGTAGDADFVDIAADGQWLWTTNGSGASYTLKRRSRENGAVDDAFISDVDFPWIATAGGNVYLVDNKITSGHTHLIAVDRDTLAELYDLDLGSLEVNVRALVTDGKHVAIAYDNIVLFVEDTGAALVLADTWDNGADILCLAYDGKRLVYGCVKGTVGASTGKVLVVLNWDGTSLSYYNGWARASNAKVSQVAFDGEYIRFNGDTDGSYYGGLQSWLETNTLLDESGSSTLDLACDGEGHYFSANAGSVGSHSKTRAWQAVNTHRAIQERLYLVPGSTNVTRIVYDNEHLFILCDADSDGYRLLSLAWRTQATLYRVIGSPLTSGNRAIHSAIVPVGKLHG